MAEPDQAGPHKEAARDSEAVYRAKYLDYCSAQVADILLQLTPDEMYVLAQDAARDSGREGELPYGEMVRLATRRVTEKLELPPLEEWIRQYRRDPDRFDPQLMGLWESDAPDDSG